MAARPIHSVTRPLLAWLTIALLMSMVSWAALASPFTINGRAPRRAVIMLADAAPPAWIPDAPSLRARMGIVAVLEGPAIGALDDALAERSPDAPPRGTLTLPLPEFTPLLNPTTTHTVYLYPPGAPATARPASVPIIRYNGTISFAEPGNDTEDARLSPDRWAALTNIPASSLDPRAPLDPSLFPPGETIPLAPPYTSSPYTMDRAGLGDRLNAGRATTITPANRDLTIEHIFLRLPRVPPFDAAEALPPRGLLLWVSAVAQGEPPEQLFDAADALNLAIISPANCGNDRDVSNRLQVTLDAVATALDRIPIDPTRIYSTGISGGGRISSMLHICFPDLFTGSVPIVGVNYYAKLPAGDGKVWPESMARPNANRFRLLREQRIAPISGPPDFNFAQTQLTVERFKLDGLDARFFSYDDQAHHMPTPARFTEAMTWVDEASTARRAEALAEATSLLESVEKVLGTRASDALTSAMRTRLDRACTLAPWTDASERAAALLGLEHH